MRPWRRLLRACGDVTPNLTLDNTGQAKMNSTARGSSAVGKPIRQFACSTRPRKNSTRPGRQPTGLRGSLACDGSRCVHISDQQTAAAAYGYSFGAGSMEDGGGQPMFREGMLQPEPFIEVNSKKSRAPAAAKQRARRSHLPKPIFIAPGEATPPALPVLPVSVARIGQLAIVVARPNIRRSAAGDFARRSRRKCPTSSWIQ